MTDDQNSDEETFRESFLAAGRARRVTVLPPAEPDVDVVVRLVGPRGPVELYPLRLESGPFPPGTGPLEFALARALLEEATRHVNLVRTDLDATPCPTCAGPIRETTNGVCQTCGKDWMP